MPKQKNHKYQFDNVKTEIVKIMEKHCGSAVNKDEKEVGKFIWFTRFDEVAQEIVEWFAPYFKDKE